MEVVYVYLFLIICSLVVYGIISCWRAFEKASQFHEKRRQAREKKWRNKKWRDRIKDAERQGRFTCQDKDNAKNWDINAVGERLLREGYSSKPVSRDIGSELRDMDHQLCDAIKSDDISEAKHVYTEINELITKRKSAYSSCMHYDENTFERIIQDY